MMAVSGKPGLGDVGVEAGRRTESLGDGGRAVVRRRKECKWTVLEDRGTGNMK